MAESSSKRVKHQHGEVNSKSASTDTRVSILEQRINELQNYAFDGLSSGNGPKFVSPGMVYADPLINLEISVLRQKEELLLV